MCKYCEQTDNGFVSINTKTIQYSGVDKDISEPTE